VRTPFAYVFDDHDIGSNNADSRVKSFPKALRAYKNMIRASSDNQESIYHSERVQVGQGRHLLFVYIDTRAFKNDG